MSDSGANSGKEKSSIVVFLVLFSCYIVTVMTWGILSFITIGHTTKLLRFNAEIYIYKENRQKGFAFVWELTCVN